MKCPTDNATLVMSERAGIEIDYCPECRGVWLDRWELDKILERASADGPAPTPPQPQQYAEPQYSQPRYDNRHQQQAYRKKKKEHWLSELFD